LRSIRDGVLVATILFITAGVSIFLLQLQASRACSTMLHDGLTRRAQAAAVFVDGDLHRTFVSPEQENSDDYRRAVEPLRKLLHGVEGLRFVYTVVLKDDQVYFVLDATPHGDADGDGIEDHSNIMEPYEDPDPQMLIALREGRATSTAGPAVDRWGTLISGYAPFSDSAGRQVGIVGVDITDQEYHERLASIRHAAFWGLVPGLLMSATVGTGVYCLRRRMLLAEIARQHSHGALQESEQYHRQIFESATDAMLLFDPEARIVDANPAACQMYGYTYDALVGQTGRQIVHPDYHHLLDTFHAQLAAGERFHGESINVRSDGSQFHVEVHGTSIRCRDRQRFLAIVRDITARKLTERDLQAAIAAAQAASQAKSEFLANMSHEIRTPMTAILGYAETLLDSALSGADRLAAVHTIDRNGRYLLGIINDILDLSKIEAGKLHFECVRFSPAAVIAETCSLMQVRAQEKGLTLALEADGPLPKTICTDPIRLRQILINLVGNAIKFTTVGTVRVVVRLRPGTNGAVPMLEYDVIDSGIGISPEQVERVFIPFSQADGSTSRRFGGTGLGLTISRRLAQGLGGDVYVVRSIVGEGTHVRLTVAAGAAGAAPARTQRLDWLTAVETAAQRVDDGRPLAGRILVAEDSPDTQRLLAAILQRAGATVVTASNGAIVLEKAIAAHQEGAPFDVILMDMQMPEMDGYVATRRIRAEGYTGPIIALTAHAMTGDREKCLDAGCDEYASKPIDRKTLITIVRRWMQAGVLVGRDAPAD